MAFKNAETRQGYKTIILSTTTDMQKSQDLSKVFDRVLITPELVIRKSTKKLA